MKRTGYDAAYQADKRETFAKIEDVKIRFETGLRAFLRTEQMVSPK